MKTIMTESFKIYKGECSYTFEADIHEDWTREYIGTLSIGLDTFVVTWTSYDSEVSSHHMKPNDDILKGFLVYLKLDREKWHISHMLDDPYSLRNQHDMLKVVDYFKNGLNENDIIIATK